MEFCLNEDVILTKLIVVLSDDIQERINNIDWYNRNNIDALSQWHNYLDGLVNYISNPVIAWDNMNRYQHFPNGTPHITELGYDVTFMVKMNKKTHQSYVFVCEINLNAEEFGLEQPSLFETQQHHNLTKRRIRLTESDLYGIVQECVHRILNVR